MSRYPLFALLLLAPALMGNADDAPADDAIPIPAAIKAMLDAAISSGNESEVSTIVKYARVADPASADQVLAIAQKWRGERAKERNETIRQASFLDLWSGRAEIGGYRSTGNSDQAGITGILDLTREGLQWRQKFRAQADYQENANITTREHYLASYEPNYKVDDRAYIYGAVQYESDKFLGYYNRLSTSIGAGYSVLKRPKITLDLELGPAYRYTSFTDDTTQKSIAARGSMNLAVKVIPGISLTQVASGYVQRFNSTVSSTSALSAKLFGPLSAQVSYNVQYESMPPLGSVSTDTTSRASIVYTF